MKLESSLRVWSPRGHNVTNTTTGECVTELFRGQLPPGMVVEGYFSAFLDGFFVSDVTFSSVLRSDIHKTDPSEEEVAEIMAQPCKKGETLFLRQTEKNAAACQEHCDNGDLSTVRLVEEVGFYDLSMAATAKFHDVIRLPPDDWYLEEIPTGNRVVVMADSDENRVAMDVRGVAYETRRKLVSGMCKKMDLEGVLPVIAVDRRFPRFANACLDDNPGFIRGIIAKRRSGNYVSSAEVTKTPDWVQCFHRLK